MSSKRIQNYEDALQRLLDRNESISFDAVAIEAGRDRGAIKGNDPEIIALKQKIKIAKNLQNMKNGGLTDYEKYLSILKEVKKLKEELKEEKSKNIAKAGQINSLIYENFNLKSQLDQYVSTRENIIKLIKE
jgi:hypothetical protein